MIRVDTSSPAYHRLTSAGFKFLDVSRRPERRWISQRECKYFEVVEFSVQCVCGRVEQGAIEIDPTSKPVTIDIARIAENEGAISVLHLRDDGYSIEEIKRIRRPYA